MKSNQPQFAGCNIHATAGFTLIEIIVGITILIGWFVFIFPQMLHLFGTSAISESKIRARSYAQDSIEATKNIRDRNWAEVSSASSGVAYQTISRNGEWEFDAGATTTGGFTRALYLDPVFRDESNNIVTSSVTSDPFMQQVRSEVSWTDNTGSTQTEVLSNYITNWNAMKNFVKFLTQTNYSDFNWGTGQNTDVMAIPDSVTLARRKVFSDDFQMDTTGTPALSWTTTKANFSLTATTSYFFVVSTSTKVIGTTSTQTSIHTHYTGTGASRWTNYEVSGRMMMTNTSGGMGITFNSLYPTTDRYYVVGLNHPDRNAACTASTFCLAAHGTSLTAEGVQAYQTDVYVQPYAWYRFRIITRNVSNQTLIEGKVWPATSVEPLANQIDHFDDSGTHTATGTIGFWTTGSGSKYLDDLVVRSVTSSESSGTYISSAYDTGEQSLFDNLEWDVDLPAGTTIGLQLRSATTSAQLASATWYGPTSSGDRYQANPHGMTINPVHNGHQWIQYIVYLDTTNPAFQPVFNEINLSYVPK
jgi:hypothetical protein